jgi:lipid-A-disaccharide synthase
MKLLVSALDPSANVHLESILKVVSRVKIRGIFERRLGMPLFDANEFAVMGIIDVLPKIFKAKKAIKMMVEKAVECDAVLLIDAPAFNLPLAKALKKAYPEKKIVYYILPKVWAWKPKRVEVVEKYCDYVLSIFPFEDQFYTRSLYVGNPLLDQIVSFKTHPSRENITAFLPGSRKSEIKRLMPIMREIASKTDGEKLLVIPPHLDADDIRHFYVGVDGFTIVRDTQEALKKARRAYICSGTATLEASLIGTPVVLLYKAKMVDFWIGKQFVKLKHVGLANILSDFFDLPTVHPELLQSNVTADNAIAAMERIDEDEFIERAASLRVLLREGSARNVVRVLREIDENNEYLGDESE